MISHCEIITIHPTKVTIKDLKGKQIHEVKIRSLKKTKAAQHSKETLFSAGKAERKPKIQIQVLHYQPVLDNKIYLLKFGLITASTDQAHT